MINQDIRIPIPDDSSFENYTRYLGGVNQRAIRVIHAIYRAWERTSQANPRPRRIVVLHNSLFWLSVMQSDALTDDSNNTAGQLQSIEELQSVVKITLSGPSSAFPQMLVTKLH